MKFRSEPISITDVTARDGFQMEKTWIPTATKIDIINQLTAAGIKRIEAAAFVSPKKVPQMRDAETVVSGLIRREGLVVAALVANLKGAKRALAAEVDEIQAVLSVSETHNIENVDRDLAGSINEIGEIASLTKNRGKTLNISLSTVFGCSYEGIMPIEKTARVIETLSGYGISSFMLSDTTGMANPRQTYDYATTLQKEFPQLLFGLHFHNARGMGIGGCPFTPKAAGNVCTEDLAFMFAEMGIKTGIDVTKLVELARDIETLFSRTLPGYLMRAENVFNCN